MIDDKSNPMTVCFYMDNSLIQEIKIDRICGIIYGGVYCAQKMLNDGSIS